MKKFFDQFKTKSTKVGSYVVIATLIALILLVIANLLVKRLPSSWTTYDLSDDGVLEISEETENIVKAIDRDVEIYWIVQGNTEEKLLGTLLERYQDMSSHIHVTKKDPDRYPMFLKQYELTKVSNNSLIVESGDRYRYLDNSTIFVVYDSSDAAYDTTFDGEGVLTTALNYVMNGKMPILYSTTGHGESALEQEYTAAIGRTNSEVKSLSLLSEGQIPEDCDVLIINAPSKDISEDEVKLIEDYIDQGGRLALVTLPPQEDTPNLDALVNYYGMKRVEGIIVESDTNYFASAYGAYAIFPEMQSHEITTPLLKKKYPIFLPITSGIQKDEFAEGVTYTALATTSASAFSKLKGYNMETFGKEAGDLAGPFDVVALAEKGEGKIIWFASAGISNNTMSKLVYGTNEDLFLNSLSYLSNQKENISIRAKELGTETLVVSTTDTLVWTIIFMVVLPLICIVAGIIVFVRRRKRK